MRERITKTSEYVANRQVLICDSGRGNPTVLIREDGDNLVEIDLNGLIEAAVELGMADMIVKEVEADCDDDISDAISKHMRRQPFGMWCTECGGGLSYKADIDSDDDLSLRIDPCECTKEA